MSRASPLIEVQLGKASGPPASMQSISVLLTNNFDGGARCRKIENKAPNRIRPNEAARNTKSVARHLAVRPDPAAQLVCGPDVRSGDHLSVELLTMNLMQPKRANPTWERAASVI